jgi:hypothetical protein
VAIALPWLEAMGEARAQTDEPARRFIAVYQPGGTVMDNWAPSGSENDFTVGPILAPLEPVLNKVLVTSGLDMTSAIGEQLQAGMVAWLTGTPQQGNSANGYAQGPSLDQVIASTASMGKPIASLEQAVRWGTGRTHGEMSPWDTVTYANDAVFTPLPPRLDPQAVWTELFGTLDPPAADDVAGARRSVLDYLEGRYLSVSERLGSADRQKLEQHLELIRQLEVDLANLPTGSGALCAQPAPVDTSDYDPLAGLQSVDDGSVVDLATDSAIPKVGRFMTDMLVMAMSCDLTAVATLQWADSEAKYTLPWLDLSETHYYYENGGGYRPDQLTQIGTWYCEQHAYLLQALDAVDVGGHSLLDESVVFFGTEVENSANHLKRNMPFLLAGGGGGLRGGRWLDFRGRSHNDLLVALLNLFGDSRQTFGDPAYCDGPVSGLV